MSSNQRGDRFMPIVLNSSRSSHGSVFPADTNDEVATTPELQPLYPLDIHSGFPFLFSPTYDNLDTPSSLSPQSFTSPSNIEEVQSPLQSKLKHERNIADALGLTLSENILHYGSSKKSLIPTKNNRSSDQSYTDTTSAETISHTCFIEAPGLVSDFYCNLVSWYHKDKFIVVGLSNMTRYWDSNSFYSWPVAMPSVDLVTCVSCLEDDLTVIGTYTGQFMLVSDRGRKVEAISTIKTAVRAAAWFKKNDKLVLSDNYGNAYLINISRLDGFRISLEFKFESHSQLICGIAISSDESQIALGSNDNYVSIWNLKEESPTFRVKLEHKGAIKALEYCPWSKYLLATGAGTADRCIRFWDTTNGSCISSHFTNGQIVSLHWSSSVRELVAIFGYTDIRSLVMVFAYPSMKVKKWVPSSPKLRGTCATISPDKTQICVACNDSNIRVFKIWDFNTKKIKPVNLQPDSIMAAKSTIIR